MNKNQLEECECDAEKGYECLVCSISWSDQILKDVAESKVKVNLEDWTPSIMNKKYE